MENLQVITARVPENIFSLLNELSSELRAARGTVIRNCLEDYLADWADYQIAKKRFDDPKDEILSSEEAGEYLRAKGWDV